MATSTLGSGTLVLAGTTSGTTTVTATAVAGTTTLTLPAATDTLVGKATTDTLTNKTLTGAVMNGTLGATTPSTVAATTLTTSSTVTHNGGTANGVAFLDGSKVLTTGSALVFDGTNLGVGVTPSAWGTGFQSVIETKNVGALSAAGPYISILANAYYNSSSQYIYTTSNPATHYAQVVGQHQWFNAASGTAGNAITFTQAMTLDSSGNLGIGTTLPGSRLDVNSADASVLTVRRNDGTDTNTAIRFQGASTSYYIGRNTSGGLGFSYNAADVSGSAQMTIDSSGNLLVGTTSSGVTNSNSVTVLPAFGQINYQHASGTSSGANYAYFAYNATGIGSITQNGTTGVLYNLTSDYRLKNDQQALTGAKDFIMALKPKKWQWWDGSGEGVGFVAHEFMEVAKYSGNGEKDAIDADGKPIMQSIQPSSSEVMANLVSFIQEQQALITQLQADVAALKGA